MSTQKFSLSAVLRQRSLLFEAIGRDELSGGFSVGLLLFTIAVIAVFGFVMGTFSSDQSVWFQNSQSLLSVIIVSFFLCFPSLVIFSALRGAEISFRQLLHLSILGFGTLAFVLMGFIPISGFFTWTSDTVEFVRIMNGVMIGIAVLLQVAIIGKGLAAIYLSQEQGGKREGIEILALWVIVYAATMIQMALEMPPFFPTN